MRALMGLLKNRHGTYYAQQRVPARLQEAVARVLGSGKPRQVYLSKSLGTKDLKTANTRAKPVLMEFDRVMRAAQALLDTKPPLRDTLSPIEIKRIAETHYAAVLTADDEDKRDGTGSEPVFQAVAAQLAKAGVKFETPFNAGPVPEAGLSDREIFKRNEQLSDSLPRAREALSRGDTTFVSGELLELLDTFQINLDKKSVDYRKLAMAVLTEHVRALTDVERRSRGEIVETPTLAASVLGGSPQGSLSGSTLRDAITGWEKERTRPTGTVNEYKRAVEMFIQLHGDLPIATIRKSHARLFREALQAVPRTRTGKLKDASLPELVAWGHKHPSAPKVSAGTVNKQLGAIQAIASWADNNGMIADDVQWSDPFHNMRVSEERSDRAPFEAAELQAIFDAPLFTEHKLPLGARGVAGVWLPLLGLFTGARQAEVAGLKVSNVQEDAATGTALLFIVPELKAGKRLKTISSERVIPVHPQLVKLGFLKYVAARRRSEGENAWLFPSVAPDQDGALGAWSKWFGRYLRTTVGIADTNKVFHSFRHGFKDAARAAGVALEIHDALTGHSSASAVSAGYGAKSMLHRFGVNTLADAINHISYPSLDLSRVKTTGAATT